MNAGLKFRPEPCSLEALYTVGDSVPAGFCSCPRFAYTLPWQARWEELSQVVGHAARRESASSETDDEFTVPASNSPRM